MRGRRVSVEVTAPGEVLTDPEGKPKRVGQPTGVEGVVGPPSKADVDRGTAIGRVVTCAVHVPLSTDWGDQGGAGYTLGITGAGYPFDGLYEVATITRTRSFFRLGLSRAG